MPAQGAARIAVLGLLLWMMLAAAGSPAAAQSAPRFDELRRYPAAEARQAVAVDSLFFYAIDNRAIGKYEKGTGRKVAEWVGPAQGPIIHLNSGIVIDGRLYCAHSNYPGVPMVSSVEVWDTRTMQHVGTHSFGIFAGSGTWLDYRDGQWWMVFAHYAGRGGEPGKDPHWTTLFRLDADWRPLESWVFPAEVVARLTPYSSSGGAWGPDGLLYVSGHDRPEVYRFRLPEAGSVLTYVDTLPLASRGQGIAWDPAAEDVLYAIDRQTREVVVSRLREAP